MLGGKKDTGCYQEKRHIFARVWFYIDLNTSVDTSVEALLCYFSFSKDLSRNIYTYISSKQENNSTEYIYYLFSSFKK